PAQRRARLQVAAEHVLPVRARSGWDARVAVAGKIGEEAVLADAIEIDELGAPRRLAHEGQAPARERVQRARFSRVRAAREGDLAVAVREIFEPRHALEESCA